VSRQATRYLCLVVIFAVSGYLIWRGDNGHIGTTPAHYVGYLIAAIGVAGLLGLNIWWGGPLDKRRDADPAGKIPRAGLIVMAIGVVAGSISSVILFVPIEGADNVKFGKYRITANFPCRPKRHKQVIGKTDKDGRGVESRPVNVADLFCSFCHSLKINPHKENMSGVGRPIKIVDGVQVVKELFA